MVVMMADNRFHRHHQSCVVQTVPRQISVVRLVYIAVERSCSLTRVDRGNPTWA